MRVRLAVPRPASTPTLFEGCTEAIGEVGGFSYTVNDDLRLYLVETAEKGIDWLRLHARGRPGHGSFVHDDNAVTALAEAVARVGRHRFPMVVTPTVRAFLRAGLRRPRHRPRPGRPGAGHRQAGPDRQPDRRHAAQHRQPDPARGRLQGQRHPRQGVGHDRLPYPARAGGDLPRPAARRDRPGHRDRAPAAAARAGDRLRRRAGRRDGRRAAGRGPGRAGGAVHALRRHRRQGVHHARHPLLRLRAAAGCRPT